MLVESILIGGAPEEFGDIRVVAKCHDARFLAFVRKQVFWPVGWALWGCIFGERRLFV